MKTRQHARIGTRGAADDGASSRGTAPLVLRDRMAVTSVTSQPDHVGRLAFARRPLVLGPLVVLVALALAALAALAFDRAYAGRVLPGVTVAGVDAAGLTPDELRAALTALDVSPATVEVVTGPRRVTVTSDALGRRLDVDGAVAAAMAAGRQSGPIADIPERFAMWRDGRALILPESVDRDALRAWVTDRARDLAISPTSAKIVASGSTWIATTAREGRRLDQDEAVAALEAVLLESADANASVELPLVAVAPHTDELDAVLAIAEAERMIAPLTIVFRDDASWTIAPETLRDAIRFASTHDRPVPTILPAALEEALAPIAEDVRRPPSETILLRTKGGSIFGFVPGKNGRNVDVAATAKGIADVLEGRRAATMTPATPASVVLSVLPPELTAEEAATTARQMTLVGAWTTRFVSSEKNGFGANITIPARLINGTVVAPGQVFDFWRTVGPVTFARGFKMGGIIESGRTNPTGAIGGGICSASTTLFNAAARAGYQILERDNHSYYIPRYPLGLDATVSKYGGAIAQNMRFRNDTPNALFIRGLSGGGWVRFEIYSLPTGRTVSFSRPSVSNVRKATDTVQYTASLKKGRSERIEFPANGMDVVVTRTVRSASGAVLHSDRWASHYVRVTGILMVGTG
jgi:vancomycin resistance protein YoaR